MPVGDVLEDPWNYEKRKRKGVYCMDLKKIKKLNRKNKILWSAHVEKRMMEREISR